MNKVWYIAIICAVISGLWFYKRTEPTIAAVLPEKSVFFIDEEFSPSFKKNLTTAIASAYAKNKNPQEVMDGTTLQFPEVASMQVQICQTDKICFYVDGAQPLFLFNDTWVVCDNGTKIVKDHFTSEIVKDLVKIKSLRTDDIAAMVKFVTGLPNWFKQNFLIDWLSKTDINMSPVDGAWYQLRVSADAIPSQQDVADCMLIGDEQLKKLKIKKKRMTYDVRFKNQIIVK